MKEKQAEIENLALLGVFDDGKIRQIRISKKTEEMIFYCLNQLEDSICVNESSLEGITIKSIEEEQQ